MVPATICRPDWIVSSRNVELRPMLDISRLLKTAKECVGLQQDGAPLLALAQNGQPEELERCRVKESREDKNTKTPMNPKDHCF